MSQLHSPIMLEEWKSGVPACPLLDVDDIAMDKDLEISKRVGFFDSKGEFQLLPSSYYEDKQLRYRAEKYRATTRQWLTLLELVQIWNHPSDDDDDDDYGDSQGRLKLGDEFTDELLEELLSAENTEHFFAVMDGNLGNSFQPIFATWKCLTAFFEKYPQGVVIPLSIEKCNIAHDLFRDRSERDRGSVLSPDKQYNPFYQVDFVKMCWDLILKWLGIEGEYIHTHALTKVNSALFLTGGLSNAPKEKIPFQDWHFQRIWRNQNTSVPQELLKFLEWYANRVEHLITFLESDSSANDKMANYFTLSRIQWELMRLTQDHWSGLSYHIVDVRRYKAMYLNSLLSLHVNDMFVALIKEHGLKEGMLVPNKDLDKNLFDALFERKSFESVIRPLLSNIPAVQNQIEQEVTDSLHSLDVTFDDWKNLFSWELIDCVNQGIASTWEELTTYLKSTNSYVKELLLLNFPDPAYQESLLKIISSQGANKILEDNNHPNDAVISALIAQVRKRGLRAYRNTIHGYHLREMNLQVIRLGRGFLDPQIVLHPVLIWLALIADPEQFITCGAKLLATSADL